MGVWELVHLFIQYFIFYISDVHSIFLLTLDIKEMGEMDTFPVFCDPDLMCSAYIHDAKGINPLYNFIQCCQVMICGDRKFSLQVPINTYRRTSIILVNYSFLLQVLQQIDAVFLKNPRSN